MTWNVCTLEPPVNYESNQEIFPFDKLEKLPDIVIIGLQETRSIDQNFLNNEKLEEQWDDYFFKKLKKYSTYI